MVHDNLVLKNLIMNTVESFLRTISNSGTRETYGVEINLFLKSINKSSPKEITKQDIEGYKVTISNFKPSTQARKMITIRRFISYCVEQGYIQKDLFKGIRIPKFECPEPEVLTKEEAEAMLRVPDRRTLQGKRDYAILALMLSTGLRKSEVCNINIGDFTTKWNSTMLNIRESKRNKSRVVKILPEVKDAIITYLKTREDENDLSSPVFFTMGKHGEKPKRITGNAIDCIVQRCSKKALIKKRVTPHTLRHSCFTLELIGGANIKQIQIQAGHSSIDTTQRYLHILDNIRDNASDKNPLFKRNGGKFTL